MIYKSPSRIDTNNADSFLNELLKVMSSNQEVIVDMIDTFYISSAALRSFLITLKTSKSKHISFKIINVSETVSDIFKVTSFDSILPIQK